MTEKKAKPAEATSASPPLKPRPKETDTGHDTQLSNVRHSLRTPLNQIIGYSEMLQEEAEELHLQDSLPDLQKIHAAGGQLLVLVNDNLSAARVAAGKLDLETLQRDGRTLLNLIFGYTELCQEHAVQAKQDRVVTDLQRIRTAAENLLALLSNREFLTPLKRLLTARASTRTGEPEKPGRTGGETPAGVPSLVGTVLVVDDNEVNRDMLSRRLERQGHRVILAENGRAALDTLKSKKVDVVLLDILMPEMDGVQTLERLKSHEQMRHTPVIMLSALDELDSVVRCIEMGAEDYLPKPFNPVLLKARLNACLEKKRLRDKEQAYLEQLQSEREKSERLLLNILPQSVANRLKQGETTIADTFSDVTVLFADLVDFTKLAARLPAASLVRMLNDVFSQFDWLAELHRIEKIKTIGDAYMVVGGLPMPRPDHAAAVAEMAVDMQNVVARLAPIAGHKLDLRIGMSSGPVVAGIIGSKKFIYDLWGDTVNTASRMESHGALGRVQVSESTYELLKDGYLFERRGRIKIKGKGEMTTYFLKGRK
jgi:class 3 adenylate cyclase